MKKMKALYLPLCFLLALASPVWAQNRQRPNVRISLTVTAKDGLDAKITSYLSREFRKIDDVIITDDKPYYRICCVAIKTYAQNGVFTGYALSFATTSTMPATMTMLVAGQKLPPEDARFLAVWNTNDGVLVDQFIQTCAPADIQKVCALLVEQIDGRLIESARKFAQSYAQRVLDFSATAQNDSSDLRAPVTTTPVLTGVTFAQGESDQQRRQAAMNAAVVEWENAIRKTDRAYSRKEALVVDRVKALVASKPPQTPQEAVALAQQAYDEVTRSLTPTVFDPDAYLKDHPTAKPSHSQ